MTLATNMKFLFKGEVSVFNFLVNITDGCSRLS